jgi:hypothetical protein
MQFISLFWVIFTALLTDILGYEGDIGIYESDVGIDGDFFTDLQRSVSVKNNFHDKSIEVFWVDPDSYEVQISVSASMHSIYFVTRCFIIMYIYTTTANLHL